MNLSLQYAERSLIFLSAAKQLYAIQNRYIGFWIVAYYSLYHSLELAVKSQLAGNINKVPRGHDVIYLIRQNTALFNFTTDDIYSIRLLQDLNRGPGGLRYPNNPGSQFLPSIFTNNRDVIEKILNSLGIQSDTLHATP